MRRNQYARWSGPRVPHERRAELIRTSCTRRVRNPTHRDNLCRGRWLCPGTPVCPEGHCQLNASHHDPATKYRNTSKPPWQLGHWNTKAGARKTSDFRKLRGGTVLLVWLHAASARCTLPSDRPICRAIFLKLMPSALRARMWAACLGVSVLGLPRAFPFALARPRPAWIRS